MSNVDSVWQISLISLFAGILIGALAYRLLSPSVKKIDEVKSDLNKSREEMASYKASVNQHFNKTSDLVNDLTQNYVKVYQHLADGAQTLGDIGTLTNLLENRQGKVSIAVSEEVKISEPIPNVAPIEAVAVQEDAEKTEEVESNEVETNEAGPKDYDDGTTQPSEPQSSEPASASNEPTESIDPAPDVDSAESGIVDSDGADKDIADKETPEQDSEGENVTAEKEPEVIDDNSPTKKKV